MSGDEQTHADYNPSPAHGGAAMVPGSGLVRIEGRTMGHHGLLGRMAYRASYGLSFGVVYPFAMLARAVPRENAMIHGLHDGAIAARDEATALWNRQAGPSESEPIIQPS